MQQPNNQGQDIDLSEVSRRIKNKISGIGDLIYSGIAFIMRNIVILAILFIIGAGLGYYADKKGKVYSHQIIVMPNFGSVDYLYAKVALLDSKIKEGDTLFTKSIGITSPKKLLNIEVEPINNVYDFVSQRETNFELLKLIADDGNISKVIEENTTSKNYSYHVIKFDTKGETKNEVLIKPLMEFFNDNDYFKALQKQHIHNVTIKVISNDTIIKQIDDILNSFSAEQKNASARSGSLVYNENTELSEIIKRKDELTNEKAILNLSKINYEKIIKDLSISLNKRNREGTNSKAKFIFPILFVGLYCFIAAVIFLVKRAKRRKTQI